MSACCIQALCAALPQVLSYDCASSSALRSICPRYTSYEFSVLPGRGVLCSGCSSHRSDCPPAARSHVHSKRVEQAVLRKVQSTALWMGINISKEVVCGQRSYVGEDGSRDAFEGLAEVLRLRLNRESALSEPWALDHYTLQGMPPFVVAFAADARRHPHSAWFKVFRTPILSCVLSSMQPWSTYAWT